MCETNCGLTDGSRIERCRLKSKCGGILNDLGIKTAHDTGDSNGSVAVADHESVLVDISFNAVKSCKSKGLCKLLYADLLNLSCIECVHGLTHFKHDVVCDVSEEVESTHTAVVKADTHVDRAHVALDILKLDGGISVAKGILDLEVNLFEIIVYGKICERKRLKLASCDCRKLACDTVVTPEVGAVCEGLVVNLENDIVDVEYCLKICAYGDAVAKIHDSVI